MFRAYFTNKWVLGGFCFLIVFSIACYFWYQQEVALYKQQSEETAEMLRQSERAQKAETAREAEQAVFDAPMESETPTPETQSLTVGDIPVDWPEGSDWPINWKELLSLPNEEYVKLPIATRKAIDRAYFAEDGLEVPPDGHYYYRDETGAWKLGEYGVPRVTIFPTEPYHGQVHQLSAVEYERYKSLKLILNQGETAKEQLEMGIHPDAVLFYPQPALDLAKQWYDELHEKTFGPGYARKIDVTYEEEPTPADLEKKERLSDEAYYAVLYPETGRPHPPGVDYELVETILDEIERELGITIESRIRYEDRLNWRKP